MWLSFSVHGLGPTDGAAQMTLACYCCCMHAMQSVFEHVVLPISLAYSVSEPTYSE